VPYLIRTFNAVTVIDPRHCGRVPQVINNFVQSDIENANRIEQNIDRVPEGDYVLMFSNGEVTYESWPAGTLESLAEIGISQAALDVLKDGYPMIILGRKGGQPGSAMEILPDLDSNIPPREQELVFSEDIVGILSEGAISSPPIGPTTNWLSFDQHAASPSAEALDTYSFDIVGITPDNAETVLESGVTGKDLDLSSIDAGVFPRLKLRMRTSNPQELMPTQLRRWTVLFDAVPEGILTIEENQPPTGIELQEGDTLTSRFLFTNVSQSTFTDSLLVEVTAFNRDLRRSFVDTIAVQAPGPGETTEFDVSVPTAGKIGTNDLKVFVNPYLQPEINYNNNILDLAEHFTVSGDDENPVLEVTVDGEFIMDGDIVSPTPVIVMRVKDENPVLLKQDTTGIELFLKSPCEGCEFERINLSDPRVTWHPASEGSDFRVEYQPETLADGIYTLRAQAEDASGNVSGTEPYMVRFEVINESRITNFFPYPNPFSTNVRFVFTLTGSEIPDGIIIQIMTVSGKVVREITQDEIGPIKIGHNITEYAWDGRDEYGDQLANGVYLYRVKVSMQGRSVDLRATSADRAFKNGVGKMYLLR
jgi:hypothetical protein